MIKLGTKLECNHFGKQTLVAVKNISPTMFAVEVNGKHFMASEDKLGGYKLMFAHVKDADCELRLKQEPIEGIQND